MAGIGADIWVCGECRSINNLRSKQCYRCRTPRDVAAVDPNQIEGTGHGRLREIALPEFRSTRWAAVLASTLLILLAVTQVVSTVSDAILFSRVLRDPEQLADPAFYQSMESLVAGTVAVATLGVALLALIAWAFWLSRAAMAMPALGLGYPAANGLMAFVENFLPGLNLFRVPAIVRDIMRRLDPTTVRGEVLIFVAWIGLLGGYLVPRFGTYLGLLGSGTLEEIIQETLLVQAIATALVVVGATFLVALIWWIERRIAQRRAAQLAGELPPEASVAAVAPGAEPGLGAAAHGTAAQGAAAQGAAAQGAMAPGEPRLGGETESAEPAAVRPFSATASDAPIEEDGDAAPLGTIASRAESSRFASRSITAATGAASTLPQESMLAPAREAPLQATTTGVPTIAAPLDESTLAERAQPPADDSAVAAEAPPAVPEPQVDQEPLPAEEATVQAEPSPTEDTAVAAEPPPEPSAEPVPEASPAAPEASPAAPDAPREGSPSEAGGASPEPPGQAATGPELHLRVESVSSMIATMDGESEPITLDELRIAAAALARANGSAVVATVGTSFGALSLAEQAFEVLTDAQVPTSVEE